MDDKDIEIQGLHDECGELQRRLTKAQDVLRALTGTAASGLKGTDDLKSALRTRLLRGPAPCLGHYLDDLIHEALK